MEPNIVQLLNDIDILQKRKSNVEQLLELINKLNLQSECCQFCNYKKKEGLTYCCNKCNVSNGVHHEQNCTWEYCLLEQQRPIIKLEIINDKNEDWMCANRGCNNKKIGGPNSLCDNCDKKFGSIHKSPNLPIPINSQKYCNNCGIGNNINYNHCTSCNAKLVTVAQNGFNPLQQPQQNSQNIFKLPPITEQYTDNGAGVLLIERYFNTNKNKYEDVFILFKIGTTYDVGGGIRDRNEAIINTACRELSEESRNLFKLSPNSLSYNYAVRHTYKTDNFVCFVIFIQGPIVSKYYYDNMTKINKSNAGYQWRESTDFIRVSKDQFINSNGLTTVGHLNTFSTDINSITIVGKAKACIRRAIESGIYGEVIKNGPVTLNYNPNFKSKKQNQQFLDGTKVYWT